LPKSHYGLTIKAGYITVVIALSFLFAFSLSLRFSSDLIPAFATTSDRNPVTTTMNTNNIIREDPQILDPNPILVDRDGNLVNNVPMATSLTTPRNGTTADGISKLLLVLYSNNTLQFSIDGVNSNNLTNGALSSLEDASEGHALSSTTTIDSPDGSSVIVAVYTPPTHIDLPKGNTYKTVNILVNDTTYSPISIGLYRVPVVLVHGVWTTPYLSWEATNFVEILKENGFNFGLADYTKYNAETFDPYANKAIGNNGINSTRTTILDILKKYHASDIAASQVDIIAHSMGGLMARGFTQQPDYNNGSNYMNGYIHRLITIGTPHFGAHLSEILFSHRNDEYCFNAYTAKTFYRDFCLFDPLNFEMMPLKTIFLEKYRIPIDKGGIEALSPRSVAYSDLCQTNVTSYAIAGSWKPGAIVSRDAQEQFYKNILGDPFFDLDMDGFQGDNDLQVNVTSQLGGLDGKVRNVGNDTLPNQAAIYNNTVHGSHLIEKPDTASLVTSELSSDLIQRDVVTLLESANTKFATSIGEGSLCHGPTVS
jgi:hypothetical protein